MQITIFFDSQIFERRMIETHVPISHPEAAELSGGLKAMIHRMSTNRKVPSTQEVLKDPETVLIWSHGSRRVHGALTVPDVVLKPYCSLLTPSRKWTARDRGLQIGFLICQQLAV